MEVALDDDFVQPADLLTCHKMDWELDDGDVALVEAGDNVIVEGHFNLGEVLRSVSL